MMTVTRCRNPVHVDYTAYDSMLENVTSFKDLGVLFDTQLSFDDHRELVIKQSMQSFGFVRRSSQEFKNPALLKSLFYAYVRSKLEYASVIWYPHHQSGIDALENVQRKFLKYMYMKVHGSYPVRNYPHDLLLTEFDFKSLIIRRNIKTLHMLHDLLHGLLDTSELLASVSFRVPSQGSRAKSEFYPRRERTNIASKSFITYACNLANKLGYSMLDSDRAEITEAVTSYMS